eukprot:gene37152-60394_t
MGAAAQGHAFRHAAGDGQHILDRPAHLGPDQVVGQIGAEGGRRQRLHQRLAEGGVGAGQSDGRGQAA